MNTASPLRSSILGFTLLELIMVLVIAGALSAVAVPRMFDERDLDERGYVDEVASSIRYAQRIAIASGCDAMVSINSNGYSLLQRAELSDCRDPSGPWTTPVLRGDLTEAAGSSPNGVSTSPAGDIVFASDGSVANGVPPAFSIGPFTLAVDRDTGAVTVSK